jgi:hypothetical protein
MAFRADIVKMIEECVQLIELHHYKITPSLKARFVDFINDFSSRHLDHGSVDYKLTSNMLFAEIYTVKIIVATDCTKTFQIPGCNIVMREPVEAFILFGDSIGYDSVLMRTFRSATPPDDSPKEHATRDVSKEHATRDVSKEHATRDVSKEHAARDVSKEHPARDISKDARDFSVPHDSVFTHVYKDIPKDLGTTPKDLGVPNGSVFSQERAKTTAFPFSSTTNSFASPVNAFALNPTTPPINFSTPATNFSTAPAASFGSPAMSFGAK